MNFKHTLCCAVLAAAALAAMTACQNGTDESSHFTPHAGGSFVDMPEPTPQSEAAEAATQVFNAANFTLLDMRSSKIDVTLLSGDYTIHAAELEGKKVRTSATNEEEALQALFGGIVSYFPGLTKQDEIGFHIEDGKCTATAAGKEGVFAGYPAQSETASYDNLGDALKAALEKNTAQ